MRSPEMLKFVLDHLKTKKMLTTQLQNYLIYYKTQQMCEKAILENGED